ncbi:tetratricopeptide repeat protein [Streptomyces sp. XM4193]|uniref:tetratricopeptide repeat protein n=1 Tax=Streptomyces sp. XM4193 TaxID=2929782 RepID=UPI001FF8A64A|nr:tetratricopeptide repeat protein [Streptomyces sp. XM4193]MCK1798366.1 tetratricopeptide repeat protein [Streptomyces sp. XM4193]
MSPATTPEWERRCAALWESFDDHSPAEFRAAVDALTAELPDGHPVALFERASALDATDRGEDAVALYERALAAGPAEDRRRQAVIQLASTLRSLGRPAPALDLLTAERRSHPDRLDDALDAFLALTLIDLGREREAAALALGALAHHLPEYGRSVAGYAAAVGRTDTGHDAAAPAAP